MARDDDAEPHGVEFLVGAVEPGVDEDLPQPPQGGTRSLLRVSAVVVAVLAVLAALIVRGVATHRPNPVAAPTSDSSTSDSPASDEPSLLPAPIVIRDEPSHGPKRCPQSDNGRSLCDTTRRVDAPVLAAVRSRFHHLEIKSVLDEQLRDIGFGSPGLWYRSILATSGSIRITVVVRVLRVDDTAAHSSDPSRDGSTTTIAVQKVTPAFVVRVSVTAPTAHLPSFLTLAALAGDPRLVG